jgi:hypothetical protein
MPPRHAAYVAAPAGRHADARLVPRRFFFALRAVPRLAITRGVAAGRFQFDINSGSSQLKAASTTGKR